MNPPLRDGKINDAMMATHPMNAKHLIRATLAAGILETVHATASAAGFDAKPLHPFLDSRCVSCHDAAEKKGGLDLDALKPDLADAETREKWTLIFDRVQRGEMLPEDSITAGFDNVGAGLRLSTIQIEKYLAAADVALDAAMRMTHPPTVVKNPINNEVFRNDPNIKLLLSAPTGAPRPQDPARTHVQNYRPLPDGFVTFGQVGLPGTKAREAGRYRLRLKAQPYQCDDHDITLMIDAVNVQQIRRLAGYFTFPPGQVRDIELVVKGSSPNCLESVTTRTTSG